MPELPEVEAVCRKLRDQVEGLTITSVTAWRCATPAVSKLAPRRRLLSVDRRGKHILMRLNGGVTIHAHLRMSGNLYAIADHRMHAANARVLLRLQGGSGIVLEDPRALARMDAAPTEEIDAKLAELGPEPLSADFTLEHFVGRARASKQPAKLFLMDQKHVAGLGNIYVAEALYRASIDPRKTLRKARAGRLTQLHKAIVGVLSDALQSACNAYSRPGHFEEAEFPCAVYGREGELCARCGGTVRRIPQGGRSTYFCPGCQK